MEHLKRILCFALSLLAVCACIAVGTPSAKAEETEPSEPARESVLSASFAYTRDPRPEIESEPGAVLFFETETDGLASAGPFTPEEGIEADKKIYFNTTNFPDKTFRNLLKKAFGRSYMKESEAKSVETINLTGSKIASLKGIEFFTNLQNLYCGAAYDSNGKITARNSLKTLDVSKNTALQTLYCDANQLTKLDVSKNTALESLCCDANQLTKLDLSKNKALHDLICENNKLTELDLRAAPYLYNCYCAHNSIKTLRLAKGQVLSTLDCSYNQLTSLDLSAGTATRLYCDNNKLKTLDISHSAYVNELSCNNNELTSIKFANSSLDILACMNNRLTRLDIPDCWSLREVYCSGNRIGSLDFSKWSALETLFCDDNALTELNLGTNKNVKLLDCSYNQLEELDLAGFTKLEGFACVENRLVSLDLSSCTALSALYTFGQERVIPALETLDGKWVFDIHTLSVDPAHVSPVGSEPYTFDADTGVFTFDSAVTKFEYNYDTQSLEMMNVTLLTPYEGEATVKLTDKAVGYKGTTPYMVHTGTELTPAITVYDADGTELSAALYTVSYADNVNPGTATVTATFTGTANTCGAWFKIYLPATTSTKVENVQNGIQVTWTKVKGAKGYVIYRRAWSTTTGGWTEFKRWNNTTDTTWTDTTVYAGTRYQYGVKAYYEDPMDNYNLGLVGPLKTTVRITTRTLNSVTGGSKRLTVKWAGSKVFTGYQVQIATDSAFTQNVQTVKITKASTYSTVIKSLKAKTTYYVRVRSYQDFEGMTYYGQWSNVKSAKTK